MRHGEALLVFRVRRIDEYDPPPRRCDEATTNRATPAPEAEGRPAYSQPLFDSSERQRRHSDYGERQRERNDTGEVSRKAGRFAIAAPEPVDSLLRGRIGKH
jgi:hypothetical protein